jgi:hypothetical protein
VITGRAPGCAERLALSKTSPRWSGSSFCNCPVATTTHDGFVIRHGAGQLSAGAITVFEVRASISSRQSASIRHQRSAFGRRVGNDTPDVSSSTVRKISAGAVKLSAESVKEIIRANKATVRTSHKVRTVRKPVITVSQTVALSRSALDERAAGISRRLFHQQAKSDSAQILSRGLARLSISNNVEGDLLSFVKAVHPGTLDRTDVHEDILAAIIRLDEAEAFLAVEPLHDSLRHMLVFQIVPTREIFPAAGRIVRASPICVKRER